MDMDKRRVPSWLVTQAISLAVIRFIVQMIAVWVLWNSFALHLIDGANRMSWLSAFCITLLSKFIISSNIVKGKHGN